MKPGQDFSISELRASASQACLLLKTLANEDRLLILCQLINGARTVGELESLLGIRQPTLSQQLTVLRQEGLVSTERKGKYIIYSLAREEVIHIMQTLYQLYCGRSKVGASGEQTTDKCNV
ncbi:MAG TPA: metalloregulator ArsR/SmtB family transcription factor [Nitrosospira sp.]